MAASLKPEEFDLMPTLGDVPRHHARTRGAQTALSFEGRLTSYAELDRHTNQVANALIAAGVRPGEAIAYLGKNSDHYFELALGAMKAGAIMAPIGWRLAPAEAAYIIDDAQARMLFVGPECMDCAHAALETTQTKPPLIAMEPPGEGPAYEAWRDAHAADDPRVAVAPEDTALLLYTSGTTGRPKGVMLTSANLMRSRRKLSEAAMGWNEWKEGEVNLVAMPAAHIGGTGWGLVGLINGVKNVVAREFNPFEILDYIPRERIAKMFMVPAALQFVIRTPRAREIDYSSLSHILYGASPMPLDLLRECMEVFGCEFVQQYGMTETTGTIVYLPPQDHDPKGNARMRSAGLPMPGVEIAILDAQGKRLGPNEIGEVATRSQANMKGYWKKPDATNAAVDAEGWLRTGDAGYLDEDGYLYIQDRIKDMIISGAENIYPAEVENAIHGHPHVAEVAVIGVPDEKWGEAVKAIVVPRPDTTPDAADIIAFARSRIAHYKAPKSVDFLDRPLPRNASGKILRRELREPYWAGRERRVN
ncbi:MAG TPA: fatty acid--CoA ligase [Vitreimonas sp.]|uniref:fatty acid--CoA ligase n=1 Tax=Vitreimonas sp. TaxID=3069702 RepID=UPI002D735E7C|nr:fatty acid--CoA ligase [Vitreimonas sp.]HYD88273.1 fatty acid--CoA ligase [Vitreimonas sp.]